MKRTADFTIKRDQQFVFKSLKDLFEWVEEYNKLESINSIELKELTEEDFIAKHPGWQRKLYINGEYIKHIIVHK